MIDARFLPLQAQGYLDELPIEGYARVDIETGGRGCVVYSAGIPVGILSVSDPVAEVDQPDGSK